MLAHLPEAEVEAISAEIARLDSLGAAETEPVLAEFRELATARANVLRGGGAVRPRRAGRTRSGTTAPRRS